MDKLKYILLGVIIVTVFTLFPPNVANALVSTKIEYDIFTECLDTRFALDSYSPAGKYTEKFVYIENGPYYSKDEYVNRVYVTNEPVIKDSMGFYRPKNGSNFTRHNWYYKPKQGGNQPVWTEQVSSLKPSSTGYKLVRGNVDGMDYDSSAPTEDDILDFNFPLDEFHLINPKGNMSMSNGASLNMKFLAKGKFSSSTGWGTYGNIQKVIYDSLSINVNGVPLKISNTVIKENLRIKVTRSDNSNLDREVFLVTIEGVVPVNNLKNGVNKIGLGINWANKWLMGIPTGFTWYSDYNDVTLGTYVDENQDGIDDNTGETIPPIIDGDLSEDTSFFGKLIKALRELFMIPVNLVNLIVDFFRDIVTTLTGDFTEFNNFMSVVFGWLPVELVALAKLFLGGSIIVGFYKLLRG